MTRATPKCIACGNTSFAMSKSHIIGAEYHMLLIHCASCGGVVSATETLDNNKMAMEQNQVINRLARRIGVPSDLTER